MQLEAETSFACLAVAMAMGTIDCRQLLATPWTTRQVWSVTAPLRFVYST